MMLKNLQKRYALSEQGAKDLIKGCLACLLQNLSFMLPVGLLYSFVSDMMGGCVTGGRTVFYIAGCAVCVGLILLTTYLQYNATYFATYVESGVRRITLAERLRQIPLSFFGKKDLSDLTSTIMADCTFLEQSFSHFIPELAGSVLSTTLGPGVHGLAHGPRGAVGAAGFVWYCGLFRARAGAPLAKGDGREARMRRRHSGVP